MTRDTRPVSAILPVSMLLLALMPRLAFAHVERGLGQVVFDQLQEVFLVIDDEDVLFGHGDSPALQSFRIQRLHGCSDSVPMLGSR